MSKGVDVATTAASAYVVARVRGQMNETPADSAATAALALGPTGGRIHKWPLPDSVALPAFVFSRYGARDDVGPVGRNQPVALAVVRMQVKAVVEGYDDTPIIEAAALLNELIDGHTGLVDLQSISASLGTYAVECTRESELLTDLPTEDDGSVFQHLGGIYVFMVTRVA